jgi:hypothetical protein
MSDPQFQNLGGTNAPPMKATAPTRVAGTSYLLSRSRPVLCVYTVRIDCAAGESGHVELRADASAPPTTVIASSGLPAVTPAGGGIGYAPGVWKEDNVAANQASLPINIGGGANGSTEWLADRPGDLRGLAVTLSEALTAGNIWISTTINGAPAFGLGPAFAPPGQTTDYVTIGAGLHPYAAGDRIGVTVFTDGAYAPATVKLNAWIAIAPAAAGGAVAADVGQVLLVGLVTPNHYARIVGVADAGAPTFTVTNAIETVL